MTESKMKQVSEIFRETILDITRAHENAIEKLQILQTEISDPFLKMTVEIGINTFTELKTRNEQLYFEVNKLLAA